MFQLSIKISFPLHVAGVNVKRLPGRVNKQDKQQVKGIVSLISMPVVNGRKLQHKGFIWVVPWGTEVEIWTLQWTDDALNYFGPIVTDSTGPWQVVKVGLFVIRQPFDNILADLWIQLKKLYTII